MKENKTMTTNSLPVVCFCLRTKEAFGIMEGNPAPWQAGEMTSASYWCLKTMDAVGPDDQIVHAKDCRAGRGCFRDPDED